MKYEKIKKDRLKKKNEIEEEKRLRKEAFAKSRRTLRSPGAVIN